MDRGACTRRYDMRSESSWLFRLGNGRPTMTTHRASSLAKLIPSESFAPTTANRIAPLGASGYPRLITGWTCGCTYLGSCARCSVLLEDRLHLVSVLRLKKDLTRSAYILSCANVLVCVCQYEQGHRCASIETGSTPSSSRMGKRQSYH